MATPRKERGGGFQKPKFLNEIMDIKMEFLEGWGGDFKLKNLQWEGY